MKVPAPFRLLLVVVFVVSFFSPSLILADGDVFLEEFNDQSVDLVHWQPNPNPNGVIEGVNNENVRLSSLNGNYFPYLYMKNVQIPDSNYSIEIKFRFSGNLTYGNGLIFSD